MPPAPPVTLDPTEVQIGTSNGPGIYIAPEGTAPPAEGADWASPWVSLGYLSEDGPTISPSVDSEDITPWQSRTPIRSVVTGRSVTIQFVMWQLNERTLALYFDSDVPDAVGGSVDFDIRSDAPQHIYAIGIDSRDGDRVVRVSFRRASLTDAGDMQLQKGAAVPLDVTLSALDDAGSLGHVNLGQFAVPEEAGASITPAAQAAPAGGSGPRQHGAGHGDPHSGGE